MWNLFNPIVPQSQGMAASLTFQNKWRLSFNGKTHCFSKYQACLSTHHLLSQSQGDTTLCSCLGPFLYLNLIQWPCLLLTLQLLPPSLSYFGWVYRMTVGRKRRLYPLIGQSHSQSRERVTLGHACLIYQSDKPLNFPERGRRVAKEARLLDLLNCCHCTTEQQFTLLTPLPHPLSALSNSLWASTYPTSLGLISPLWWFLLSPYLLQVLCTFSKFKRFFSWILMLYFYILLVYWGWEESSDNTRE